MTVGEFRAWTKETADSQTKWKSDPIFDAKGQCLFYRGGVDGKFIGISESGDLIAGSYEGAVPHIGEALFKTTFAKKFDSKDKAFQRVVEVAGPSFLIDLVS